MKLLLECSPKHDKFIIYQKKELRIGMSIKACQYKTCVRAKRIVKFDVLNDAVSRFKLAILLILSKSHLSISTL